jgi:hypothetical protein
LWALANFSAEKRYYAGIIIDSRILDRVTMFIQDKQPYTDFVMMESLTLVCSLLSCNLPLPQGMIQRPLVVLGRYLSILDVTKKNFS